MKMKNLVLKIKTNIMFIFQKTAALAQKNSEATRALVVQSDILEKELGEIQKVLLAMQVIIPSICCLNSKQPILCNNCMNLVYVCWGCALEISLSE